MHIRWIFVEGYDKVFLFVSNDVNPIYAYIMRRFGVYTYIITAPADTNEKYETVIIT